VPAPGGGRWAQILWIVAAVGAAAAVRYRPLRRVEVVGSSMVPALLHGDRLLVVRAPWHSPFRPGPGVVVALRDPRRPDRVLIKRVRWVDRRTGTLEVVGDAGHASTDSRTFGPVSRSAVLGRAVYRYGPVGRNGPLPRRGGVPSAVMTSHQDDLARILNDSYLEGMADRSLANIRAMRAECQEAEVALSYLRRLIQGRLDIVHAYLEPGAGGRPDLGAIVRDLPGILTQGRGRPPGPGHLPQLLTPDTEEAGLTAELDAVLGADDVGSLGDLDADQLTEMATKLEAIEAKVSADRRALHERIDALQAELVQRHKTGRATVDGLLS
jgi:nickel-type superoxide dismutase maturation protease